MPLNLNTATRRQLKNLGLSRREIDDTKKFIRENAVFHSKLEWKKHCNIPEAQYEAVQQRVLASKAEFELPREVLTRDYRAQNNINDRRVHVGHIIARANRGANHPANYIKISGRYNQMLGSLHDGVLFAHISEDRLREAVKVSRLQMNYNGTFADAKRLAAEAVMKRSELPLYREGFRRGILGGGFDAGEESLLCNEDYCQRLIEEWREHYPDS